MFIEFFMPCSTDYYSARLILFGLGSLCAFCLRDIRATLDWKEEWGWSSVEVWGAGRGDAVTEWDKC